MLDSRSQRFAWNGDRFHPVKGTSTSPTKHPPTGCSLSVFVSKLTSVTFELYCGYDHGSIIHSALIAQLVERVTSNDEVAGSTPS